MLFDLCEFHILNFKSLNLYTYFYIGVSCFNRIDSRFLKENGKTLKSEYRE